MIFNNKSNTNLQPYTTWIEESTMATQPHSHDWTCYLRSIIVGCAGSRITTDSQICSIFLQHLHQTPLCDDGVPWLNDGHAEQSRLRSAPRESRQQWENRFSLVTCSLVSYHARSWSVCTCFECMKHIKVCVVNVLLQQILCKQCGRFKYYQTAFMAFSSSPGLFICLSLAITVIRSLYQEPQ